MPDLLIVGIEALAALVFFVAFLYSYTIFQKTKAKTDIWMLISFAVLIASLTSGFNAAEWFFEESPALDTVGEYLSIIFSVVWIYVAYRFISLKNTTKETPER